MTTAIELKLLAVVHERRRDYEEASRQYIAASQLAADVERNADGAMLHTRSLALSREVAAATDRYRIALREFADVVIYRKLPI
jgi:hypothetical protein